MRLIIFMTTVPEVYRSLNSFLCVVLLDTHARGQTRTADEEKIVLAGDKLVNAMHGPLN